MVEEAGDRSMQDARNGDYALAAGRFRRPNALKHGGFSKTVLFPWEDREEFEALHRSLQDEWKPAGALEDDAVFTILTCIWRKRRLRDTRTLDILASMQEKDFNGTAARILRHKAREKHIFFKPQAKFQMSRPRCCLSSRWL
jgi:hypothetical protein